MQQIELWKKSDMGLLLLGKGLCVTHHCDVFFASQYMIIMTAVLLSASSEDEL